MNFTSPSSSLVKIFAYGQRVRVLRDWLVLLLIALALFFSSVALHAFLFLRAIDGELIGSGQMQQSALDTSSLETVRTIFEARAGEELRYRGEYRFVDPSTSGS
jgi:hypothetical protein